jgi:uncharacterized phage protein (TIGR01671 family)
MREILFRGKRCDNGEWVEGLPIKTYDTEIGKNSVDYANPVPVVLMASGRIVLECGYDEVPFFNIDEYPIVNPETISQFTGLKDSNGNKIFEGDIIQSIESGETGEIQYFPELATFLIFVRCSIRCSNSYLDYLGEIKPSIIKVIGNIHDNPELMEANQNG